MDSKLLSTSAAYLDSESLVPAAVAHAVVDHRDAAQTRSSGQCRICLDSDPSESLIAPCACRGTSLWVHRECLNEWRATGKGAFAECGECKTPYILVPPTDTAVAKLKRRTAFVGICGVETFGFFLAVQLGIALVGAITALFDQEFPVCFENGVRFWDSDDDCACGGEPNPEEKPICARGALLAGGVLPPFMRGTDGWGLVADYYFLGVIFFFAGVGLFSCCFGGYNAMCKKKTKASAVDGADAYSAAPARSRNVARAYRRRNRGGYYSGSYGAYNSCSYWDMWFCWYWGTWYGPYSYGGLGYGGYGYGATSCGNCGDCNGCGAGGCGDCSGGGCGDCGDCKSDSSGGGGAIIGVLLVIVVVIVLIAAAFGFIVGCIISAVVVHRIASTHAHMLSRALAAKDYRVADLSTEDVCAGPLAAAVAELPVAPLPAAYAAPTPMVIAVEPPLASARAVPYDRDDVDVESNDARAAQISRLRAKQESIRADLLAMGIKS